MFKNKNKVKIINIIMIIRVIVKKIHYLEEIYFILINNNKTNFNKENWL